MFPRVILHRAIVDSAKGEVTCLGRTGIVFWEEPPIEGISLGKARSMRILRLLVFGCLAFLVACGEGGKNRISDKERHRQSPGEADPKLADTTSPPGKVVEDLLIAQYQEIRKAGGLPLVVTATGKRIVVVPTLYSARCDSCRLLGRSSGQFECHLTIRLSLKPDGSDPSEQGERLFVRRSALGTWTTQ